MPWQLHRNWMKLGVLLCVVFGCSAMSVGIGHGLVVVWDVNVSMLQPGVQDQPAVCDLAWSSHPRLECMTAIASQLRVKLSWDEFHVALAALL